MPISDLGFQVTVFDLSSLTAASAAEVVADVVRQSLEVQAKRTIHQAYYYQTEWDGSILVLVCNPQDLPLNDIVITVQDALRALDEDEA